MSDSKKQDSAPIDDIRLDAIPVDEDDIQQDIAQVEGVALASAEESTIGDVIRDWWRRVRVGDIGSLPIIIGLIVIAVIFGIAEPLFFSSRNFVNLLLQMAGIATIAIGVVFVLLIGEIDLSIGYVSGVSAVVMVLLLRPDHQNLAWPLAIGAALIITIIIGFVQGTIITRTGAHSFVVTLAGLLVWSGVVLILTTISSTAGTIIIQNDVVVGIANEFLSPTLGWILWSLSIAFFAVSRLSKRRALQRQNLPSGPMSALIIQLVGLIVITGFALYYANQDRGVPVVFVIVWVFLLFWSFIADRTRFGRYVYAVGGNQEAARRAGINVDRIRVQVFMITSFMAGVGGIILASRLRSVDTATGGGNLMLNAIAAAVIGGTSLFGGVGFVMSALLGALIIASVENGMGLLGLPSGVKFVINGLVLLAAVLVDALSRRRRQASGIV
ncbi:MAG TPA: ABC transporter permease [Anaerolineae bacterium]|jgi:D-xylose transport system permease protein|nr:ABC transporter permease [Anaerolineae bacterium]